MESSFNVTEVANAKVKSTEAAGVAGTGSSKSLEENTSNRLRKRTQEKGGIRRAAGTSGIGANDTCLSHLFAGHESGAMGCLYGCNCCEAFFMTEISLLNHVKIHREQLANNFRLGTIIDLEKFLNHHFQQENHKKRRNGKEVPHFFCGYCKKILEIKELYNEHRTTCSILYKRQQSSMPPTETNYPHGRNPCAGFKIISTYSLHDKLDGPTEKGLNDTLKSPANSSLGDNTSIPMNSSSSNSSNVGYESSGKVSPENGSGVGKAISVTAERNGVGNGNMAVNVEEKDGAGDGQRDEHARETNSDGGNASTIENEESQVYVINDFPHVDSSLKEFPHTDSNINGESQNCLKMTCEMCNKDFLQNNEHSVHTGHSKLCTNCNTAAESGNMIEVCDDDGIRADDNNLRFLADREETTIAKNAQQSRPGSSHCEGASGSVHDSPSDSTAVNVSRFDGVAGWVHDHVNNGTSVEMARMFKSSRYIKRAPIKRLWLSREGNEQQMPLWLRRQSENMGNGGGSIESEEYESDWPKPEYVTMSNGRSLMQAIQYYEGSEVKADVKNVPKRLFQCHICHNTFTREWNLKNHIRTHTGEKPYPCPVCFRRFNMKHHLKRHLATHGNPSAAELTQPRNAGIRNQP